MLVLTAYIKESNGRHSVRCWVAKTPDADPHLVYVGALAELTNAGCTDRNGLPLSKKQFAFVRSPHDEPTAALAWALAEYAKEAQVIARERMS
jgi:hypothetical protein